MSWVSGKRIIDAIENRRDWFLEMVLPQRFSTQRASITRASPTGPSEQ